MQIILAQHGVIFHCFCAGFGPVKYPEVLRHLYRSGVGLFFCKVEDYTNVQKIQVTLVTKEKQNQRRYEMREVLNHRSF